MRKLGSSKIELNFDSFLGVDVYQEAATRAIPASDSKRVDQRTRRSATATAVTESALCGFISTNINNIADDVDAGSRTAIMVASRKQGPPTVSLSRGVVTRGEGQFIFFGIEGGRLRYVWADGGNHAWQHEEEHFYIRADGEEVPTIISDEQEEAFMEAAEEFPEDPLDFPEEIMVNLDGDIFRARSMLFEHDVCLKQFRRLEEKACENGEEVLTFEGEESEEKVLGEQRGKEGNEDETGEEFDRFEIENIFEGGESVKKVLEEREGDSTLFQMEVEGVSHLVLSEGDLENEAKSTTPTRMLPRMWTVAEAKWFAKRWSYDENACDKVGSGEYTLEPAKETWWY